MEVGVEPGLLGYEATTLTTMPLGETGISLLPTNKSYSNLRKINFQMGMNLFDRLNNHTDKVKYKKNNILLLNFKFM